MLSIKMTTRRRDSEGPRCRKLHAKPVVHVIDSNDLGQLGLGYCPKVAGATEGARLFPTLIWQARRRIILFGTRCLKKFENLLQSDHIAPGWFGAFHFTLLSGRDQIPTAGRFLTQLLVCLWGHLNLTQ